MQQGCSLNSMRIAQIVARRAGALVRLATSAGCRRLRRNNSCKHSSTRAAAEADRSKSRRSWRMPGDSARDPPFRNFQLSGRSKSGGHVDRNDRR
jgi:hypothetical protein